MQTLSIATTTTAPASQDAGAAATLFSGSPEYTYAGEGRFLPANQSALDECAAWNRWADAWNARTAARSAP